MNQRFIARQPIFDRRKRVIGYELLYRDRDMQDAAQFQDGSRATCYLLADAITVFGLPQLTCNLPAFINFTQPLIMGDFILLANPAEVVVEILEDCRVDDALVGRLRELKKKGYRFALDDYTGAPAFDPLLALVDIVKVDFRLTTPVQRAAIARRFNGAMTQLLAEKVETEEEYHAAVQDGYSLFQGYFFEKPTTLQKKAMSLSASSYARAMRELQRKYIDFNTVASIIHADVTLTYRLMQKARSLRYYRGNSVTAIKQALIMMGSEEIHRWLLLILAREHNVSQSDELVRLSYIRGLFAERLMQLSPLRTRSDDGFLLGMFSLLDKILGIGMDEILVDLSLPPDVAAALLGTEENDFSFLLQYVLIYEMANPALQFPDIGLPEDCDVAEIYMRCLIDADNTFSSLGDKKYAKA